MKLTDSDIQEYIADLLPHIDLNAFARAIEAHVRGEQQVSCAETCRNYEGHADHCPDKLITYIEAWIKANYGSKEKFAEILLERNPLFDELVFKPVDPLAELKAAHAEGKQIEYSFRGGPWVICNDPMWFDNNEYRIKPESDPLAEVKAAHAKGKMIEYLGTAGTWEDLTFKPWWDSAADRYRIKDPHAELKAAYAEGKVIECRSRPAAPWYVVTAPAWYDDQEYRIKEDS